MREKKVRAKQFGCKLSPTSPTDFVDFGFLATGIELLRSRDRGIGLRRGSCLDGEVMASTPISRDCAGGERKPSGRLTSIDDLSFVSGRSGRQTRTMPSLNHPIGFWGQKKIF